MDEPSNDTVLDSIAFAAVGELLILCYLRASPSDAEWDIWLARERRMEHRALLVWTDGGSPNARQRARVAAETGNGVVVRPPVALMTDSMVLRSVMTAFTWVLGGTHPIKAFPRYALETALEWLAVPVPPARVRGAILRLSTALAAPRAKKVL